MSTPQTGSRAGQGSRWRRSLVFAVAILLVAVGWYAGSRVRSPAQAAAKAAAPSPSLIGVPVELRTLSHTVIVRGDVRPSVSLSLSVPGSVSGSAVVTGVFVKQGDVVSEGDRVLEVSGRPLFVVGGAVPVYRDLKPGMSGADVAQLQAALARLGCASDADGATYGAATKACVAKLYEDAGYVPVPVSVTERADIAAAGRSIVDAQGGLDAATAALTKAGKSATGAAVLAAQDSVNAASRAVADVLASGNSAVQSAQGTLNAAVTTRDRLNADPNAAQADRDAATASVPSAQRALQDAKRNAATANAAAADALKLADAQYGELLAAPDTSVETHAVQQAQVALDAASKANADLVASTGATVAQGEIVFVPSFPARVDSQVPGIGPVGQSDAHAGTSGSGPTGFGGGSSGSGLLTLAAGSLRVSARVNINDKGLLHVGMAVDLLDELSNKTYFGSLSGLDDTPTIGADQTQGYVATITTAGPLPNSLSGTNLRVTFTAAATEGEVFVVPLAAVSSAANGQTRVDKLLADNKTMEIGVTAGLSADGFVAITPGDPTQLSKGDLVVVSAQNSGGSGISNSVGLKPLGPAAATDIPAGTKATLGSVGIKPSPVSP
jgi:hypothetical protein